MVIDVYISLLTVYKCIWIMKLYVRLKVNGKWTFRAACPNYLHIRGHAIVCTCIPGVKQE